MRLRSTFRPLTAALVALVVLPALGGATASPVAAADGPTVSVGDVSGLERDTAIGSVFVPVFLDTPSTAPVVVSYYTVNDTAIYIPPEDRVDVELFGDYQRRGTPELPRTVTIPAGTVQTTINVNVNVDDEVEADEQFSVVIASVSGGDAVIGDDTGHATIVDADGMSAANPAITVSSGSVVEGDTGQRKAQFFVHLSAGHGRQSHDLLRDQRRDRNRPRRVHGEAARHGDLRARPDLQDHRRARRLELHARANSSSSFALAVDVTGGAPVEELQMTGSATILDDDQPPAPTIVAGLAAGNNHTCALDSSGSVKCWGGNALGQLGDGTATSSLAPVAVTGLPSAVAAIAAGDSHTCALGVDGGVRCWGNNLNGQLGDGTNTQSSAPVSVTGLSSGVSSIAAGDNHTCAGLAAGGITCWGWGTQGQLGANSTASSNVPVAVQGLTAGVAAVEISAGYQHTCATLSDGATKCWGRNNFGQLGIGSLTPSRSVTAVQPVGLGTGTTAVVAGGNHTCVVQSGAVKCFGLNGAGQLGNGAVVNATSPVAVTGLTGIDAVAAGGSHSCSLATDGGVSCWGLNQEGELGIGDSTVNNSSTPRSVTGLTGQIALSAGIQHVCAMAADESVRCWGLNSSGQLGNGSTTRSFSPVSVAGL